MPTATATPRARATALAGAAFLGLALALGFLPTAASLHALLPALPRGAAFAGLALLFHLSLPRLRPESPLPLRSALSTIPVPIAIAAVYGWFHPSPSVFELAGTAAGREELLWFLLFVPLGEEWLFRGWVPAFAERLWPRTWLTDTNPLPVSVWVGAVAFSLWHLQNAAVEPPALVAFQVAYTLFTGLWLGWMRWRTGLIFPCILAHLLINLGTNLW